MTKTDMPGTQSSPVLPIVVVLLLVATGLGTWLVFSESSDPLDAESPAESQVDTQKQDDLVAATARHEPAIKAFCGDCHLFPNPAMFPRDAWFAEVEQGFKFYHDSGRNDLVAPPMRDVVAYFRSRAPESLGVDPPGPISLADSPLRFSTIDIAASSSEAHPSIAHLKWLPEQPQRGPRLVYCDMGTSQVYDLRLDGRTTTTRQLGQANHPAHAEPFDLNGDEIEDLIVAGLGSFLPADHDRGSVVWLKGLPEDGNFQPIVLADGLGRVADVQPGDFNGDGRTDLIVAEFGWRKTGDIVLLLQTAEEVEGVPQFERQIVDKRHGTIHVLPVDMNDDGLLDFIALVSQEFEQVDVFINRGDATFETKTLYAGEDPSFGSSGIQLVDLDSDGDLDVLYTNGDTLDSFFVKSFHAVRWLENQGSFPFVEHNLLPMPGASRAIAGDLDGDGDRDIVACSYIPDKLRKALNDPAYYSLVWLEQVERGEFRLHPLEQGEAQHFALELGDFDGDGRTDIAVGNHIDESRTVTAPAVRIWWNEGPNSAESNPVTATPASQRGVPGS